jgi:uncharacterized protein YlxP (DUF503 family)
MRIGSLEVKLFIGEAGSLKGKRRIVKSLKDNIRNRFNASVAEVDNLDKWQSAVIGVAVVGNDDTHLEGMLTKVVNYIRTVRTCQLVDYSVEIY